MELKNLKNKSKNELIEMCKKNNIKGYSKFKKNELIKYITICNKKNSGKKIIKKEFKNTNNRYCKKGSGKYVFKTKEALVIAVNEWNRNNTGALDTYGPISTWDVSIITDMSYLFENHTSFNQDISDLDVSNVTDMTGMFMNAESFNQDISGWKVSNVINMAGMFINAESFNQDISDWKVSKVTNMEYMFTGATNFNQDIGRWYVSNVTDMTGMFMNAESFNQNIRDWDVSNVTGMTGMFSGCPINEIYKPKPSNIKKINNHISNTNLECQNYRVFYIPNTFIKLQNYDEYYLEKYFAKKHTYTNNILNEINSYIKLDKEIELAKLLFLFYLKKTINEKDITKIQNLFLTLIGYENRQNNKSIKNKIKAYLEENFKNNKGGDIWDSIYGSCLRIFDEQTSIKGNYRLQRRICFEKCECEKYLICYSEKNNKLILLVNVITIKKNAPLLVGNYNKNILNNNQNDYIKIVEHNMMTRLPSSFLCSKIFGVRNKPMAEKLHIYSLSLFKPRYFYIFAPLPAMIPIINKLVEKRYIIQNNNSTKMNVILNQLIKKKIRLELIRKRLSYARLESMGGIVFTMFSTEELNPYNFYEVLYQNPNTAICKQLKFPVNLLESEDSNQRIIIGNQYLNNRIKYSYTNNLMSI
jgi:surface protein